MVRMLVDAKALLQARNPESGWVPLHEAARHGNLDAIKELLEVSGAPSMPRTAMGEFPIDFAREHMHTEIIEYLNNFQPKPPATHKSKWCHGTLGRNEAVTILQEFALELTKRILEEQYNKRKMEEKRKINDQQDEDVEEVGNNTPPDCSGIFLVRVSDRNKGNYVLTLLNEDQVKHFVIYKSVSFHF
jgi:tyrosine-protein kinase shark